MHEPRDGDFVAYIEALQRESAARLAAHHIGVNSAAADSAATIKAKAADHFFRNAAADKLPQKGIEQSLERLVQSGADGTLVKGFAASVAGLVFLLLWLANGGAIAFLIAVALFAYAVPRLLGVFRAFARPAANRGAVDQVFGRGANRQ